NRQASDNWRYEVDNSLASNSNSNRVTAVANEEATEEFDSDVYFNMVRDSYLNEVPLTQGALDSMHRQIHDQLIVTGNIYRDYTQTNNHPIGVYEALLKLYSNTPYGTYS